MKLARKLGLIVLVNSAAGVIPAVLVFLYRPGASLHSLAQMARYGSVYSYCIGSLAFLTMERMTCAVHRIPQPYRIPLLILTYVLVALVGSLAANAIFMGLRWIRPEEFWFVFRFGLRISIAITLLVGSLVTVFEGLSYRLQAARLELRTRQLAEERAHKLAGEARLSSLESRVHPHFLFNTLNSISELIREDPARAERTVGRLADLLRYSLDTHTRPLAPLRQELRVIEDYLEIEKTRFGDRLRYAIDAPAELGEMEVPPMAAQTLVENSIKHAIAASRRGGEVRVTARLAGSELTLEVSDDGPGFDWSALKPGHGLENLQERLAALFGGEARMEVARHDGRTVVRLALPQKKVLV